MTAKTRDGQEINIGSEVTTEWHKTCIGNVFVVFQIIEYACCESGFLVNVHLKGDPTRIMKTSDGLGLDTNWFKLVL